MSRDAEDVTVPEAPRARAVTEVRPAGLPERYRLVAVIGAGGMGRVYRAHDTALGRDVAIKVLDLQASGSSGTRPRDRFVREARAAARLVHPNIVAVHDVDADAGWLVMDLIDGESLRDIAGRGAVPIPRVKKIAEQMLGALDVAHASGVIHRDIKPSNIIMDAADNVKLVDFGVARLVDVELTTTGESLGTPAYMSPEQLRGGAVDARTDLYGLAATLFELITGERMIAFETPSTHELARVRSACGDEYGLGELVVNGLQGAPEDRPASARDAAALLVSRPPRRALPRWGLVLALLVIAGVGVAWWKLRSADTESADARRMELFALAQRGEHEKAGTLLEHYVSANPEDDEARAMLLLNIWWETGRLVDPFSDSSHLTPVHRDMLHGLALLASRSEAEAVAFLQDAQRRHRGSVEIAYALGEAYWHSQHLEHGAELLAAAFASDPRWQMALHHVIEFRLSRGETAALVPIEATLRSIDPPRAAALACQIAIADGDYAKAIRTAETALATLEPFADVHVCLAEAQILSNDLVAAEHSVARAIRDFPVDLREWGARSVATELLLYRGQLDEFLADVHTATSRQKVITVASWTPDASIVEDPQTAESVRGQPIVPATQTLISHIKGFDPKDIYEAAPELELRAYGRGLAAEQRNDLPGAIAEYRQALAVPSKGDIRMLVAHELARVLRASGDETGAATACREVIAPHQYVPYRAALMPDCLLWSNDPARWRQLDTMWIGPFVHPSVVEARRRLAASP